jgi:tripartite-type tricarboxylate transporter receptor subunit TctC
MFRFLTTLALACVACVAPLAGAATFPDKPVRLIVPFPPGGGSDTLARILSKKLQEIWGQPLVIDNRGGAQGSVGTAMGAKAPPDGYTIVLVVHGALAINPFIYDNVGYDVLKDFAPIVRGTEQSYVMVANPNVPVKTMKDVETLARANPGKLTFATSGAGPQLVGELFKLNTKTNLLHVPYKGAGPASVAVLAGETDLMISNPTSAVQHVKAGKLRGIAVLGKERNPQIPDVPSALEAGYPDMSDVPEWYGFAAPAGTPEPIIAKLNADFVQALNDPEVQKSIRALGTTPSPSTPEEFAKQIKFDYERWGKVVKAAGVKAE